MNGHAGAETWEIAKVKAQYFRFLDLKLWDDFRALFTDDATFEHPTIGQFDDVAAAVDATRRHIGDRWTAHEAGIPEITLHGPVEASGIFPMSSHSFAPAADHFRRTWGHYHDGFRCIDGVWRISAMRLQRFSPGLVRVHTTVGDE